MKKQRFNNLVRHIKTLTPGYEKRKIQHLINVIEESDLFNNTSEAQSVNDYLVQIKFIEFEIKQTIDMINPPCFSPLYNMMKACHGFKNTISTNQFLKLDLILQSVIVQEEKQALKNCFVHYINSFSMFHNITVKCVFKPEIHRD